MTGDGTGSPAAQALQQQVNQYKALLRERDAEIEFLRNRSLTLGMTVDALSQQIVDLTNRIQNADAHVGDGEAENSPEEAPKAPPARKPRRKSKTPEGAAESGPGEGPEGEAA